jgi:hypothetical protein
LICIKNFLDVCCNQARAPSEKRSNQGRQAMRDNDNNVKWKVLTGGLASYLFDALDLSLLAMAFQPIMNDFGLT